MYPAQSSNFTQPISCGVAGGARVWGSSNTEVTVMPYKSHGKLGKDLRQERNRWSLDYNPFFCAISYIHFKRTHTHKVPKTQHLSLKPCPQYWLQFLTTTNSKYIQSSPTQWPPWWGGLRKSSVFLPMQTQLSCPGLPPHPGTHRCTLPKQSSRKAV